VTAEVQGQRQPRWWKRFVSNKWLKLSSWCLFKKKPCFFSSLLTLQQNQLVLVTNEFDIPDINKYREATGYPSDTDSDNKSEIKSENE
jgi:hypothetical protein